MRELKMANRCEYHIVNIFLPYRVGFIALIFILAMNIFGLGDICHKYQTTIIRLWGFVHMLLLSCHLHLMVFMTSSIFLMDDHYKFTLINYHLILCSRLNCHQILIKREWSIHKLTSCIPFIWQDKKMSMCLTYILSHGAPKDQIIINLTVPSSFYNFFT